MSFLLARWWLLAAALLVAAGVLALVKGRAAAQKPLPPPQPAAAAPRVLPGDHSRTPLFPALDAGAGRWGFIDAQGTFVIAAQYANAAPFSEGLAFVADATDGRLMCIDKNNREQFSLVNPSPTGWLAPEGGFKEGFALLVLQGTGAGNKYTYVDRKGALLGPPRFWPARAFSGGLAAVAVDGRWGFLGPDGKPAITTADREVFDFTEGVAAATKKRRMGYIDAHGKEVIPARYELALEFGDGLAPVQPGSPERGDPTTMGYIDHTGRLAIPARFAHAHRFSEGRARVLQSPGSPERWGYIDTTGKMIVEARYDQGTEFHDGLAAVRVGPRWGYVDRDGHEVIPPSFETAGDFSEGLARVRRHGDDGLREGYIDHHGEWVYAWASNDRPE